MKTIFLAGLVLLLLFHWSSADDNGTSTYLVSREDKRVELIVGGVKQIKDLWTRYHSQGANDDTFVGRCFGMAKKLRMIMPIAIFLLGVILTVLGFLTLFSLKSLAMLGALLLINTSGAVAKVVSAFSHKTDHKEPQNVHVHVHQGKEGYHVGHTSSGWDDRIAKEAAEKDLENSESYNLYNKLIDNPYVKLYSS